MREGGIGFSRGRKASPLLHVAILCCVAPTEQRIGLQFASGEKSSSCQPSGGHEWKDAGFDGLPDAPLRYEATTFAPAGRAVAGGHPGHQPVLD